MALFAANTFQGLGRVSAEGRLDGHLAAFLTALGTEHSYRTLDADGDIDGTANDNDEGTNPDPDARPRLVIADTSGGTVAASLPPADEHDGRVITVIRVGGNNATIVPDGSDQINGGGTVTLSANFNHRTLFSDGTQWLVIASS